MYAGFSVELGADDPMLEVPWASEDDAVRYVDLRSHPELLTSVPEAMRWPELASGLRALNRSASALQTAKCDAWFTRELDVEDEVFASSGKFGGYIDAFFCDWHARGDFGRHEAFAKRFVELLRRAPDLRAACEVIVRRARFNEGGAAESGYYFTVYVFGYGDEQPHARTRWSIALRLVQNAILQISTEHR